MKWISASGVLCDLRVPVKLKEKFSKTALGLSMLYGSECWAIKMYHIYKMSLVERRMLRWMNGKI